MPGTSPAKKQSLRALQATNFFLADVQTGLGPFLAAYLAGAGWQPGRVGVALTLGGVVTVLLQTPAGALVDRVRAKRAVLIIAALVLAAGAVLLSFTAEPWAVYASQVLIGGSGPFLAPTLAAITMGLVGATLFDRQFGKNQSFNSGGNVACALLIAAVSHFFGNRAIFIMAAILTVPTIFSVLAIRRDDIDYELSRGGKKPSEDGSPEAASILKTLLGDRVLLIFLICAFFFHFANAAMLPQLGEMLSNGSSASAAPFMSACIIVTQVVIMCSATSIGRIANVHGRKPLLVLGFAVLPVRAVLYTITHNTGGLIAVQLLDGVANAVFGVVSILVVADRTRGTGRFNLVQGALATAVGLGAALSTTFGGKLIQHYSYRVSFLALGAAAVVALALLAFGVPETLHSGGAPLHPLREGRRHERRRHSGGERDPEDDEIIEEMIPPGIAHILLPAIVAVSILLMLIRPRGVPEVYWIGGGALLLVLLRLVPLKLAGRAIAEGSDVYLFLIGMMLLSELAREQGVFDWLSSVAVRSAKGSCSRLFTLVYGIGTIVTIFMSNDATAVVLTPAILTAVRKARVEPLPYLFVCALIANAASFVLPISNPANLVVFHTGMPPLGQWLLSFGVPSVVSIAATYAVMRWIFRKELLATIDSEVEAKPLTWNGKLVLAGVAAMVGILLTASSLNKDLGLPTCLAALAVTIVVSISARTNPAKLAREISWGTLALVAGLFVMVDAVQSVGALAYTQRALAWVESLAPAVGAFVASFAVGIANNLVNNLPLGLIAGSTLQAAHTKGLIANAVMIGVDLGPNLSITGSLATILWLIALRKDKQGDLHVSFWSFLKVGAIAMPVALLLATGSAILIHMWLPSR